MRYGLRSLGASSVLPHHQIGAMADHVPFCQNVFRLPRFSNTLLYVSVSCCQLIESPDLFVPDNLKHRLHSYQDRFAALWKLDAPAEHYRE